MDTIPVEIIVTYLVFIFIGVLIGESKGRPGAGLFWGLLLGPLGWLLVGLGPNFKKKEEARQDAEVQMQIKLQQAQLEEIRALRLENSVDLPADTRSSFGTKNTIRISLDGQEIRERTMIEAIHLLEGGEVTLEDLYFDETSEDWVPLESHPVLSQL